MFNPRGSAEIISQQIYGQILSSGFNAFSVLKKDGRPRKTRNETGASPFSGRPIIAVHQMLIDLKKS
jgi:hypothetical protein